MKNTEACEMDRGIERKAEHNPAGRMNAKILRFVEGILASERRTKDNAAGRK
jgi:hypothetical protein